MNHGNGRVWQPLLWTNYTLHNRPCTWPCMSCDVTVVEHSLYSQRFRSKSVIKQTCIELGWWRIPWKVILKDYKLTVQQVHFASSLFTVIAKQLDQSWLLKRLNILNRSKYIEKKNPAVLLAYILLYRILRHEWLACYLAYLYRGLNVLPYKWRHIFTLARLNSWLLVKNSIPNS